MCTVLVVLALFAVASTRSSGNYQSVCLYFQSNSKITPLRSNIITSKWDKITIIKHPSDTAVLFNAVQSSNTSNGTQYPPSLAIDGNSSTFSRTDWSAGEHWWSASVESNFEIYQVSVICNPVIPPSDL